MFARGYAQGGMVRSYGEGGLTSLFGDVTVDTYKQMGSDAREAIARAYLEREGVPAVEGQIDETLRQMDIKAWGDDGGEVAEVPLPDAPAAPAVGGPDVPATPPPPPAKPAAPVTSDLNRSQMYPYGPVEAAQGQSPWEKELAKAAEPPWEGAPPPDLDIMGQPIPGTEGSWGPDATVIPPPSEPSWVEDATGVITDKAVGIADSVMRPDGGFGYGDNPSEPVEEVEDPEGKSETKNSKGTTIKAEAKGDETGAPDVSAKDTVIARNEMNATLSGTTPTAVKNAAVGGIEASPKDRQTLAEQLGIDLTNPYSTWDYIRDMSAGLLASDSSTFAGALGDAALLSNKNRAEAVAANKLMDAKIKLKKWEYEKDLEIAGIKAAGAGEKGYQGGISKTAIDVVDPNTGVKTKWRMVTPEYAQSNPELVSSPRGDGNYYVTENASADNPQYERFKGELEKFSTEQREKVVEGIASEVEYQGDPLLKFDQDDDAATLYGKAMGETQKIREERVALMGSDDRDDQERVRNIDQMLINMPIVQAANRKMLQSGVFTNLKGGEKDKLDSFLRRKAWEDYEVKGNMGNAEEAYRAAANKYLPLINWGIDGAGKWYTDISEAEYQAASSQFGDRVGEDLNDEWFNTNLTNLSSPPDDGLGGPASPFQLDDEVALFNKNQWGLLSNYDKGRVRADVTQLVTKIVKQSAGKITTKQANDDVVRNLMIGRRLSGGEDRTNIAGAPDINSKYERFETWKFEPAGRRQGARDIGLYWDGQRGLWVNMKTGQMHTLAKPVPSVTLEQP